MGEDLDVPALEEEKKEGILSKAISFFTKIFKIEKEVELEETKAPERVDGSAEDTKNQMMRSFRSMRQWTERMKQRIPTTLIIKIHRIPMVKFWIPRKFRIRMRKIRRIKVK